LRAKVKKLEESETILKEQSKKLTEQQRQL
jgi:hypothetical protein